jgi:hypothetical protein
MEEHKKKERERMYTNNKVWWDKEKNAEVDDDCLITVTRSKVMITLRMNDDEREGEKQVPKHLTYVARLFPFVF